ncbi:MAG TPA: 5-deoxy-glucuronate isomerase [Bdellovibrionales bacterium]|nr:5-deoxy-glucuronate isomerase [Bdellovibrionales bacterium]
MLNTKNREGFAPGYTQITSELDAVGIEFGILKLKAGQLHEERTSGEAAYLLMNGSADIKWMAPGSSEGRATVSRTSLFDDDPTTLHACVGSTVGIRAETDCEWAVMRTENNDRFDARLFLPSDVKPEYRGKGLAQDACLRNVRLVFDRDVRPESKLVVGEVVNYPGRWSSYPPHHHDQPEIYHYRFTLPQGYGHGEVGDDVFKLRNFDTLSIAGGNDHAQVSAPGYGMYYLWIVRHLDGNPYLGFEFTEDHRWVLDPKNQGWEPKA